MSPLLPPRACGGTFVRAFLFGAWVVEPAGVAAGVVVAEPRRCPPDLEGSEKQLPMMDGAGGGGWRLPGA